MFLGLEMPLNANIKEIRVPNRATLIFDEKIKGLRGYSDIGEYIQTTAKYNQLTLQLKAKIKKKRLDIVLENGETIQLEVSYDNKGSEVIDFRKNKSQTFQIPIPSVEVVLFSIFVIFTGLLPAT